MKHWKKIVGIGFAVGVFALGDGLASAMPGTGVPSAVADSASATPPVVDVQYYPYPYPYAYGYPCVFPFRCGYGYYGRGYYGRGYYGRGYGYGGGGRGFAGRGGHR
jgi:hypothetical protein